MKKLLKYSITDGIQSFMPILLWALLPLFYKDSIWVEGLIVTYPYQFIGMVLYNVLFLSQIKYEEADHLNNRYYSMTGILLYSIVWITLYAVSVMNWKFIQNILGLTEIYYELFVFSLASMGMSFILMAVITLCQYEDKNKQGMIMCFMWWISEICFCVLFSIFDLNLMTVIILMFGILIFILIYELKGMRFKFCPFGIKYIVTNLSGHIGMAVVYILGLNKMCMSDINFLSAYNMMTICSDVEWDVVDSATDKYVTIETAEGKWNEKTMLFYGFIFGIVLFLVCILSVFICSIIPVYKTSINFKIVWILIVIEGSWFFIDSILNIMEHWISFAHPNPVQPVCTGMSLMIRTVVTIIISSVWSVSIAMVAAETFYMIYTVILYLWFRYKDTKALS